MSETPKPTDGEDTTSANLHCLSCGKLALPSLSSAATVAERWTVRNNVVRMKAGRIPRKISLKSRLPASHRSRLQVIASDDLSHWRYCF